MWRNICYKLQELLLFSGWTTIVPNKSITKSRFKLIPDSEKIAEAIFPAKLRVLGRSYQMLQYFTLGFYWIINPMLNSPKS